MHIMRAFFPVLSGSTVVRKFEESPEVVEVDANLVFLINE